MKIFFYCQHVYGVGHFFRTLEILNALAHHDIMLVTGGQPVEIPLPAHVRTAGLSAVTMDSGYQGLHTTDPAADLADTLAQRRAQLYALFEQEAPDLLVVEFYPFGRKAFQLELDPILAALGSGRLPQCRVVCSLRDILVEKKDQAAFERRVIDILNRQFDALLVHADPAIVRLEETFARLDEITVPVVYTGFVAPQVPTDGVAALRDELGMSPGQSMVVVSVGGGKSGAPLLEAAAEAFAVLKSQRDLRAFMFAGPYCSEEVFQRLKNRAGGGLMVSRFTRRFLTYLAAADLSVSMAGYNTAMNILATGVPALVWPFGGDREQGLRARRLENKGALGVLTDADLAPRRLAAHMQALLEEPAAPAPVYLKPKLDGARNTALWLDSWMRTDRATLGK